LRGRSLGWLVGIAALAALTACATPRIYGPVPQLVHPDATDNPEGRVLLSLNGEGFGPGLYGPSGANDCARPGAGSFVRVLRADGTVLLTAESTDPSTVRSWSDRRIVITAPSTLAAERDLRVEVCTPRGASGSVATAAWQYDHFDLPRSDPTANPSPLAIAIDGSGGVWVNEEFHTQLKGLSPSGAWSVFDLPQAPGPGIFASALFPNAPSRAATLGESILVDPRGRVWLTEAGPAPYAGSAANHARIVMLDPESGTLRMYNVPGDGNGVVGLAFDPTTGRVWFTEARRSIREGGVEHVALRARLTSFDPDGIAPDPRFDFKPRERCVADPGERVGRCSVTGHRRCLDDDDCVLAAEVCPPAPGDDRACFREHEIPEQDDVLLPGPLLRHSDGTLWYSAFWGGDLVGRFDPATGVFQRFRLAPPPGEATCDRRACWCFVEDPWKPPCPSRCCEYLLLGRGPWKLDEEADRDVVFCSQSGGSISRIPWERRDDPRCAALGPDGANPCVVDHPIPGYDPAIEQMHSLAADAAGNVWFEQSQMTKDDPNALSSVGFLQAATERVILFPPLSIYPYVSRGFECQPAGAFVGFQGAGIAVDPRTGAVWFADFCRKRLGRIVPLR